MDKSQYKTLKKVNDAKLYEYTNSTDEEIEIIHFLAQCGYVRYETDENETSRRMKKKLCRTTQLGKSYIGDQKQNKVDKWVPYIITTTISVLALLKSYGYGIENVFIWCKQLLEQLSKSP